MVSRIKSNLLSGETALKGMEKLTVFGRVSLQIFLKAPVLSVRVSDQVVLSPVGFWFNSRLILPSAATPVVMASRLGLGSATTLTEGFGEAGRPKKINPPKTAKPIKAGRSELERCLAIDINWDTLVGPIINFFGVDRAHIDTTVAHGVAEVIVPIGAVEAETTAFGNFVVVKKHDKGHI